MKRIENFTKKFFTLLSILFLVIGFYPQLIICSDEIVNTIAEKSVCNRFKILYNDSDSPNSAENKNHSIYLLKSETNKVLIKYFSLETSSSNVEIIYTELGQNAAEVLGGEYRIEPGPRVPCYGVFSEKELLSIEDIKNRLPQNKNASKQELSNKTNIKLKLILSGKTIDDVIADYFFEEKEKFNKNDPEKNSEKLNQLINGEDMMFFLMTKKERSQHIQKLFDQLDDIISTFSNETPEFKNHQEYIEKLKNLLICKTLSEVNLNEARSYPEQLSSFIKSCKELLS